MYVYTFIWKKHILYLDVYDKNPPTKPLPKSGYVCPTGSMDILGQSERWVETHPIPRSSMYGIFTYIWDICRVNVGKYTSTMDDLGNVFCN